MLLFMALTYHLTRSCKNSKTGGPWCWIKCRVWVRRGWRNSHLRWPERRCTTGQGILWGQRWHLRRQIQGSVNNCHFRLNNWINSGLGPHATRHCWWRWLSRGLVTLRAEWRCFGCQSRPIRQKRLKICQMWVAVLSGKLFWLNQPFSHVWNGRWAEKGRFTRFSGQGHQHTWRRRWVSFSADFIFFVTQLNSVTKKTARPQATFDLCPITSHQSAPSLLWRMGKAMKPIVMAAFLSTQVASPSTAVLVVVDQVNNSLLFEFSYHYFHQFRRTLLCRWWRRLRRWRWQSGRGLLWRRWLIYQWESCVWRDGSRQQLWPWVGHFRTIVTSSSNTYTRHAVNYLINPKSKTANRTNHDATKCVNVNSLLFIVEFKKFIQKKLELSSHLEYSHFSKSQNLKTLYKRQTQKTVQAIQVLSQIK